METVGRTEDVVQLSEHSLAQLSMTGEALEETPTRTSLAQTGRLTQYSPLQLKLCQVQSLSGPRSSQITHQVLLFLPLQFRMRVNLNQQNKRTVHLFKVNKTRIFSELKQVPLRYLTRDSTSAQRRSKTSKSKLQNGPLHSTKQLPI